MSTAGDDESTIGDGDLSITTCTTNGYCDLTSDQVFLTPKFANYEDPSVAELRLLRARVLELEGAQSMASSLAGFDLLSEQNGDDFDDAATLDGDYESEEGGSNGQIDGQQQLEQFCEELSKLELEMKDFKESMVIEAESKQDKLLTAEEENEALQRELKHQKLVTEHAALQAKVTKVEQQLKMAEAKQQQQQQDSDQQKLLLIQPQNGMNSADCHKDLCVIQPDCLTVYRRACTGVRSVAVRAQFAIPRHHFGIFYFEIKVEKVARWVRFGLVQKSVSLGVIGVGHWYVSVGAWWGHHIPGCLLDESRLPYFGKKGSAFTTGDVAGCGLNLATRQIIYTKNGKRLDTADLFVELTDVYPTVALKDAGDRVKVNFGPNFMYDLNKEYSGQKK